MGVGFIQRIDKLLDYWLKQPDLRVLFFQGCKACPLPCLIECRILMLRRRELSPSFF